MLNSQIIRQDCKDLANSFESLSELFNKSFLITGSNGLIGNYLVNFLDVLNELYGANIKAYCITKHKPTWKADRFTYWTADLSSPINFYEKVDYIFHAACYATPKKFLENPLETIYLNVSTTSSLLYRAKEYGAKMLFLSSGAIYGNPTVIPVKEETPGNSTPFSERAPYIESKRLGETLCHIYGAKVVRLGYIYGPGSCDGRVMNDFIKMAIKDKKIQLTSHGWEFISWCYVTDALKMMLYVLLRGENSPYNVDGNSVMSVYKLAFAVAKYFGIKCERGDKLSNLSTSLDITKICNEFKINSFVPFDEGLERTIKWNLEEYK